MSPAPKNPRRSAFLAVLLLIGALIVWRLGKPSPNVRATDPTPPPTATATSAEGTPGAGPVSADAGALPERPSGPVKREGVNAANLYADAFALYDQLTDAEKQILKRAREEVDADEAARLFEKIQPILELLRAAAKANYCDWGLGEWTFDAPVPHLHKAQAVGGLARWAAAYRFSSDPTGAIDDLGAMTHLGRQLSDMLIGVLISTSFEAIANNLLRERIPLADSGTMARTLEFIRASTIDQNVARAMQTEAAMMDSMGKTLLGLPADERVEYYRRTLEEFPDTAKPIENSGAGSVVEQLANKVVELMEPGKISELLERRRREAWLHDSSLVESEFAYVQRVESQLGAAIRLPEAEFQSWWKAIESDLNTGHPFAKQVLPVIVGVQANIQQRRVERALLTAGIDVLQHGPAQLAQHRDPATGGALQYVPTPTGFELRSPYLAKGKPMTMTFSRP